MIANRYSLEREIGRGGMGAVWLGRDELLGRPVAIKRVGMAPGALPDGETTYQRAEREARIAASLNHRHVVAIFDLVEDGDHQWLVMEFVDGRSLAQVVREDGPFSHEMAAAVLADTAHALATAHAVGIVHRDVKPSNILLTQQGEAKLLDFGIAKSQGDLTLTQTGLVSGSPAYLSPEVASGRPATTASDVWSLGATLYHLLSGSPPYDVGDNIVGGLYRIVHEEPPELDDADWLGPLLAATLVRDPDQRWSMARVATYLETGPRAVATLVGAGVVDRGETQAMSPVTATGPVAAAAGRPTTPTRVQAAPDAPPPASGTTRTSRRGLFLLAAVVLALVVAIVVFLLLPDEQQDPPGTAGASLRPSPSSSTPPTSSPSSSPSASSAQEPTPRPTAPGMRDFLGTYLDTAASDPAAGFAMLTPGFKAASGGLAGYEDFWGDVAGIESLSFFEADPEGLVVGYTYAYRTDAGAVITEDVSLQLTYDPAQDTYLIADEA